MGQVTNTFKHGSVAASLFFFFFAVLRGTVYRKCVCYEGEEDQEREREREDSLPMFTVIIRK